MGVDRAEEAAEHKKPVAQPPSPWDCGSPLYDAFELASVHRVLDTHLMTLPPFARPPRRPCDDDGGNAVAKSTRATARSRRRRSRRAVGVAKAATRTAKAVLLRVDSPRPGAVTDVRAHDDERPAPAGQAVLARAATADSPQLLLPCRAPGS